MKRSQYLFSSGKLSRKDNTICFKTKDGKKGYIPVENTEEIFCFGEVSLSKKVLELFTQKEIIMHYYSYYGYYMGTFYPREHYNSGYMILKQVEHYMDDVKRLTLAKKFVSGSAENILKVLTYYDNRDKAILNETIGTINELLFIMDKCETVNELMSLEGRIREMYYSMWDSIIQKDDFKFEARTRRPPKNYINALISFGNSILYTVVLGEIYKTHLDPRIGYLHTTNDRRFTLNLDIAEIFKPILVDRTIFTLLNKGELSPKHFIHELNGVMLNENGRKVFLKHWDERLKQTVKHGKLKRSVSYRRLIRMECYKIEKHIMGEKLYKPFISYW